MITATAANCMWIAQALAIHTRQARMNPEKAFSPGKARNFSKNCQASEDPQMREGTEHCSLLTCFVSFAFFVDQSGVSGRMLTIGYQKGLMPAASGKCATVTDMRPVTVGCSIFTREAGVRSSTG